MVGPDGRAWVGNFGFDHREGDDPRTTCVVRVADPPKREVLRVREGGEMTRRISTGERGALACALGGDDRRTLYVCTASATGPAAAEARSGRIESIRVEVPGTGWP